MKLRYSMRTLLILVTGFSLCVIAPYWIPKSRSLSIHESYVGYYRGLGLNNSNGYFGTHWYRIVVHEEPGGYWEVDVDGLGYSPYRGYYTTGVLREEGMCLVEKNGYDIAPNRHDLLDAKYFDPNGNLISEVKSGTGKQVFCYASGQRQCELDLERGKYAHVRTWHPNGQLAYDQSYRNGLDHGPYVTYYPDGQVRYAGEYKDGQQAGIRTDYAVDGTIESVTTYDSNGRVQSVTTPNEEGK